jgi:hypothetical protein
LHKEKHLDICKRLLDYYGAECEHFLGRIVTEDETWTHHYEPERKHQNMDWKHRHSPTKKKFKTISTAGNLMLTVFGTLSKDGLNNEHCSLQCDELSMQFEANEEDCCQKVLCCCTTMPVLTLLPTLLKPLRN